MKVIVMGGKNFNDVNEWKGSLILVLFRCYPQDFQYKNLDDRSIFDKKPSMLIQVRQVIPSSENFPHLGVWPNLEEDVDVVVFRMRDRFNLGLAMLNHASG